MYKIWIGIFGILLLNACSYTWYLDRDVREVTVRWHKDESPEICSRILDGKQYRGCAFFRERECDIWTDDTLDVIKHELLHCLGYQHKETY